MFLEKPFAPLETVCPQRKAPMLETQGFPIVFTTFRGAVFLPRLLYMVCQSRALGMLYGPNYGKKLKVRKGAEVFPLAI